MPVAVAAPRPAAVPAPAPVAAAAGLSPAKEAIVVAKIIEEMRPVFRADGGDVDLVDMEGSLVLVQLTGACSGCQLASATLGGLAQRASEALGRPIRVMPVAKS
nr:NifU family protein [Tropicimonas sp. IMCC34043]